MQQVSQVGLILIGDELLSGKRVDRHLPHVAAVLKPRGKSVAWARLVGDDETLIASQLSQTRACDLPVFCFGGIGATPDDRTRAAAATAFDVRLERNPAAVAEIEQRFGAAAYPQRIRMADLPAGCRLIPNPYNRIPGFSVGRHHFFPGFTEMAWPMLDWVLENCYPDAGDALGEESLLARGVVESQLIDVMEHLGEAHPAAKLFCLPKLPPGSLLELGFRGPHAAVREAMQELRAILAEKRIDCRDPGEGA